MKTKGADLDFCANRHAASRRDDGTFLPKWIQNSTRRLSSNKEKYLLSQTDDNIVRVLGNNRLILDDLLWYADSLHGGRKDKCLGVRKECFHAKTAAIVKVWETYKYIHIPVNIRNTHWIGVTVLPLRQKIKMYDSSTRYGGRNRVNISGPCNSLLNEAGVKELGIKEFMGTILADINKRCMEIDEATGKLKLAWNFEVVNDFIYQQNSVDCGVFVCLFFDLVTKNVKMLPPQKETNCKYDIQAMRKWVAFSILNIKKELGGKMRCANTDIETVDLT